MHRAGGGRLVEDGRHLAWENLIYMNTDVTLIGTHAVSIPSSNIGCELVIQLVAWEIGPPHFSGLPKASLPPFKTTPLPPGVPTREPPLSFLLGVPGKLSVPPPALPNRSAGTLK